MNRAALASSRSPAAMAWHVLRRDGLAVFDMLVLLGLVMLAIGGTAAAAWLDGFDPATVRLTDKLLPPRSEASALVAHKDVPALGVYLLGTDELGRDVLARMLQGASVSLLIGFVAVSISIVVGLLVGALAGYFGELQWGGISVDTVLMRFTDAMLCFPTFFLILTAVALLPPSTCNIMVIIGLTSWMGVARFVRAELMSLRTRDFIIAAEASGLSAWRIITAHLLLNAIPPVLVTATVGIASAILTESALSFLGFSVQPPDAIWGNILVDGKIFLLDAPWLLLVPGLAILLVALAFNLVGEGLCEALDPRRLAKLMASATTVSRLPTCV